MESVSIGGGFHFRLKLTEYCTERNQAVVVRQLATTAGFKIVVQEDPGWKKNY
jgi:hypothetical protein